MGQCLSAMSVLPHGLRHRVAHRRQLHDGTDFAAGFGTPVYAAHAGRVRNLQDPGGYGQYVQIDGNGLMTQYGHVRDMWIVPDNTWVEPGTLIAGVGSEGMSTGPHLHFRLHVDGEPIDPVPWLADAAWNPGGASTSVEQQVYNWLTGQGMSGAGAAGVMGNFMAESLMDPGIVEGMTHSLDDLIPGVREGIGLLQWSYTRREDLLAYAASVGQPWQDAATQLDFMRAEIANGYESMWAGLQLAADPRVASRLFASTFVRPGVYGSRDDYAQTFYARILAGEFGTPAPAPTPTRKRLIQGDDMATLWLVHEDGPNDNEPFGKFQEAWLWEGVPSQIRKPGIAIPGEKIQRSEWDAKVQAWCIANDLEPSGAYAGAAAGRPVFRPVKA